MDAAQFDRLTLAIAASLSRRSVLRTVLGVSALGVLRLTQPQHVRARSRQCKPTCGECQQCATGRCRKNKRGRKVCTKGKCKPANDGITCENNVCRTCQGGVCSSKPASEGTTCENNPCRECRNGVCSNTMDDTTCNSTGKCLSGTCNPRPTCVTHHFPCTTHAECCGGRCFPSGSKQTTNYDCGTSEAGQPCYTSDDCIYLGNSCVGYRCRDTGQLPPQPPPSDV